MECLKVVDTRRSPHNILLDALVSQGIFGLFLLLSLIGVGIYCLIQARKLNSPLAWAPARMMR